MKGLIMVIGTKKKASMNELSGQVRGKRVHAARTTRFHEQIEVAERGGRERESTLA